MTAIDLREVRPTDQAFVRSSWLRSYRSAKPGIRTSVYFNGHKQVVDGILADAETYVLYAVPQGEDAIVGWVTFNMTTPKPTLHYVYVKGAYRNLGLSKVLIEKAGCTHGCRYTHKTELGTARLRPTEDWVYDPYV